MNKNTFKRLETWYSAASNGDWEHTYGITIKNVDNPGWDVRVDLIDTKLHGLEFSDVKVQRELEDDWIICKVESGAFQGYCGPNNLEELISIFLDWSDRVGN